MKKLIVVINDLERSGNSVLARSVLHHLKSQEINALLVTSNEMDMTETFEGEFWDLEDQMDESQLIGTIDAHDAIVVDVHTGAARNWGEFCEATELDNLLAELDTEMTLVIPDTRSERCNEEICDLAEIFADSADYVIAHLPGDGDERTEVEWKGSPAAKAIKFLGASEFDVPATTDELATALATAEVELSRALDSPSSLPRFAEVQVTQWAEKVSEKLDTTSEYLIPEEIGAVALDY